MQSPFLCKSTIYMLSKRLELIPNFQELFIIIITISPQAADNTLFRIITHFDLDKEKNNEIERIQQMRVFMLTTYSTHRKGGSILRQRTDPFPQSTAFGFVILLPWAPSLTLAYWPRPIE